MKAITLISIITFWMTGLTAQQSFPGRDSQEWNELTVAQRWQAVNIPVERLHKMSTIELIEHCVNFDFMWDIFNHPNYSIGLNIVIENHNGLRELLNRKDAGELILDFYKKIELERITKTNILIDQGKFVAKIFFLELFLCHTNIMNQFQGNEKELVKSILKSHDTCLEINSKSGTIFYCGYAIGTKILTMGRVLSRLKDSESIDPALAELDLTKLTTENYNKIIEDARKF